MYSYFLTKDVSQSFQAVFIGALLYLYQIHYKKNFVVIIHFHHIQIS